jgi:hypothetical protein
MRKSASSFSRAHGARARRKIANNRGLVYFERSHTQGDGKLNAVREPWLTGICRRLVVSALRWLPWMAKISELTGHGKQVGSTSPASYSNGARGYQHGVQPCAPMQEAA